VAQTATLATPVTSLSVLVADMRPFHIMDTVMLQAIDTTARIGTVSMAATTVDTMEEMAADTAVGMVVDMVVGMMVDTVVDTEMDTTDTANALYKN